MAYECPHCKKVFAFPNYRRMLMTILGESAYTNPSYYGTSTATSYTMPTEMLIPVCPKCGMALNIE
jgi:hypothetical protein